MRLDKREMYVLIDDDNVPVACARLSREDDGIWITSIMVSRNAEKGTGKKLLELMKKKIPKGEAVRIGTSYDNFAMIKSALDCGFKIVERDEYGYFLEFESKREK